MSSSNRALFDETFAALQSGGPLKTWSLIVTIFGDMAPTRAQKIDSQTLGALCSPFGVKPEALRVALHRLRKDGWLEAERSGRRSSYRLTTRGEAETSAAYARIYAAPVEAAEDWQITLAEDARRSCAAGQVALGANLLVGASHSPQMRLPAQDVPEWMRSALAQTAPKEEFDAFAEVLSGVLEQLAQQSEVNTRAALRLLVLHYWRRLVLRAPDLGERLLGPDWPGFTARALTQKAFERLGRPTLEDITGAQAA